MDMPDRFSRNGARTVILAGVALFVVILGLLAVQMASGKDPALGARKPAKTNSKPARTNRVAAAPQPVQPPQPSYSEPGYDDGGGGYTDDGSQDGYVVPQQDTQQQEYVQPQQSQPQPSQQSQAPLQSSTS